MSRIGNYNELLELTYEEATKNCLDVAAQYGIQSDEYHEAQLKMLIAGRRAMKALTKTEKLINFLYKIQWLLKRKKF